MLRLVGPPTSSHRHGVVHAVPTGADCLAVPRRWSVLGAGRNSDENRFLAYGGRTGNPIQGHPHRLADPARLFPPLTFLERDASPVIIETAETYHMGVPPATGEKKLPQKTRALRLPDAGPGTLRLDN